MNVHDWIRTNAAALRDRPALQAADGRWSHAALARRIDETAALLAAQGIGRGDAVAWLALNSGQMLATLFACARLGAMFVPLNWRLAAPEHRAMLAECEPALLAVDEPFTAASAALPIAPKGTRCVALGGTVPRGWARWDDLAERAGRLLPSAAAGDAAPLLLCYTSGSTGRPKGVVLSHAALHANADASAAMHGLTAADRVLTTLPLFHVGGLNILTTPALRAGCTVTLHPKFDADDTLAAIESERITLTVLVPAQLDALIAHPRWVSADLSSLRMITTGSTVVPQRLIEAVHARGVPLVQVWGATETAPIAACLHAHEAVAKAGSTGRAACACELRVVDMAGRDVAAGVSGEILVRGANVMSGYWRDPRASALALAGGWFHSGDSGHLDADGFLWVDGRLKDMIISGGENVSPAEVEAVLLDCPEVSEAAVVGRPDDRWGEVVVAVVAPKPGTELRRERVLGLFDGRLARFKHPKDLLVVDALPRNALGKVLKEDLRRLVAAQANDPGGAEQANDLRRAAQGNDELRRGATPRGGAAAQGAGA
ncbi:MAG: AMP-binding protein [Ideonella sp.]|nr:AMP-binding protein [Ideonella sp.]MCC7457218.1 AMP-binding protein [Nitrospira sp.]